MSKQATYLTHVALSFLPDIEVTLLSHALPRTEYKQATWFVVLTFRKKSNYFSRTCITFVVENFHSRILNALGVPSLPVSLEVLCRASLSSSQALGADRAGTLL